MVIVVDDADRENEGDLVMAGEKATPAAVNFMARFGRGLICVPATGERLQQLGIEVMVARNQDSFRTDFQVSVDAASGVTTGISAADRARTIRVMCDPAAPQRSPHPVPELLLFRDDGEVAGRVLGPQRGRALEHHVLEQVGDARDARPLVGRPHARHPAAGDARLVMPLHQQQLEAVRQRLLHHRDLLRPCRRPQRHKARARPKESPHKVIPRNDRPGPGSISHPGRLIHAHRRFRVHGAGDFLLRRRGDAESSLVIPHVRDASLIPRLAQASASQSLPSQPNRSG